MLAGELADGIRRGRDEITRAWLKRIADEPDREGTPPFPADLMLERGPVLLAGIADFLEDPRDEIGADVPVIGEARALGVLRFSQGFGVGDILKEYELLGGVLMGFAAHVLDESPTTCTPSDMLACSHRLFGAISIIGRVTTSHFVRSLTERVGEREERLRRFNRMISHELKNRVGATLGAGQLLSEDWLEEEDRRRFARMVTANAGEIQRVLEDLTALSQVTVDRRRQRHALLADVIADVLRQQREIARGRGVSLRVAADLPHVDVNAAAVELCLSNYVSNAIKYSDPDADSRVEIGATVRDGATDAEGADGADERQLVIRVRDNGLGVPADRRDRLFERFYRAHPDVVGIEGTGLGLNIVQETVESMGGRVWAEFDDPPGSVFALALPCRRDGEENFRCVDRATGTEEEPVRPDAARAKVSD